MRKLQQIGLMLLPLKNGAATDYAIKNDLDNLHKESFHIDLSKSFLFMLTNNLNQLAESINEKNLYYHQPIYFQYP